MILQLYTRQLSLKALTIDHGGEPFFIPKTFPHKMIENYLVEVEIPDWFKEKHGYKLDQILINTNLTIKRLCELSSQEADTDLATIGL